MLLAMFSFIFCILLLNYTEERNSEEKNVEASGKSSTHPIGKKDNKVMNKKELSLQSSLVILFLCIIALVAEFVLLMIFGVATGIADPHAVAPVTMFGSMFILYTFFLCIASLVSVLFAALDKRTIGFKVVKITAIWGFVIFMGYSIVMFFFFGTIDKGETTASVEQDSTIVQIDHEKMYIDSLEIRNIKVGKDIFDRDGVFGEIKNLGSRTISKIEIVVYALDSQGQAVYEDNFFPVLVTDYGFSQNDPLKPNYTRSFGYRMDDAPSEWAKQVEIRITNVEFEEASDQAGGRAAQNPANQ